MSNEKFNDGAFFSSFVNARPPSNLAPVARFGVCVLPLFSFSQSATGDHPRHGFSTASSCFICLTLAPSARSIFAIFERVCSKTSSSMLER